jgi:hypothetical protein
MLHNLDQGAASALFSNSKRWASAQLAANKAQPLQFAANYCQLRTYRPIKKCNFQ